MMRLWFRRCPDLLWRVAVCLMMQELVVAAEAVAQPHKQVLVVYSTRRDSRLVEVGDQDVPRIVETGLKGTIDYYSEFVDQSRFPRPDYQDGVRDFLHMKYRAQKFDVIIAVGDPAIQLVSGLRDQIFPGIPVVFFATRPVGPRLPNSTGIMSPVNFADTLTLAGRLHPDLERVFVLAGAGMEADARRQFEPFASRYEITYLTGLPPSELEAKLSSLPRRSIVYYMFVPRDSAQHNFQPLGYLSERLAPTANAPIYSWVDSTMGTGVVGGSMKDQAAEMRSVAELALRVLRGESAESIPIDTVNLNVPQVDWRQLRRWQIDEARVPPGTLVRFRDPGVWDRYRGYVVAAMILVAAQSVLIGGLLVQASRRRQAEERLIASQAKLQASYEQISALGGRLLIAQEAERANVARELHDGLGQQVAVLVADLYRLTGRGREASNEFQRGAETALEQARSLAKNVHDLSHSLHPANLRLLGLPAALDGLQREVARPGVSIALTYDNLRPSLPHDLTLCVYRVVQESVHNALKHSQAREILVHVHGGDSEIAVDIVDDGVGFDVNARFGRGLGLVSMNERIEAFGGSLKIRSTPRHGTRLKISIPLADARARADLAPETGAVAS